MINLTGPQGITSVSVDGVEYAVSNGKVSVKPEHVSALGDMGFAVVPETADDPNFAPTDDIETMSRNELFAFLKAKGVAVTLPITNDALRQIARDSGKPADSDAAKVAADKAAADQLAKEEADKAAADKKAADDAAAAAAQH